MKVGELNILECRASRGENDNIQRRTYQLLEEQFERIVLVHYRELKEDEIVILFQHHSLFWLEEHPLMAKRLNLDMKESRIVGSLEGLLLVTTNDERLFD
ncbi:calmodulin-binding transcription activator 3-like isoform X2 [Cornus florida]|uniref:calmodulin-binding transcription activator 3-like isoform X2 n=1 Tax=Cornus florida TaxID=4283 RepID=UPI00289FA251|nr:calmodulin-binding transcription activator 3-like isoform X2 [Cornus florida]